MASIILGGTPCLIHLNIIVVSIKDVSRPFTFFVAVLAANKPNQSEHCRGLTEGSAGQNAQYTLSDLVFCQSQPKK